VSGDVAAGHHSSFETLRHVDEDGNEFWLARELMPVLEYETWRSFKAVIAKAMTAAEQVNQPANDHFAEVGKMVQLGSGTQREIDDFRLSRYACYLIVQNGDPSKPVIAAGQTYFAIQTRRQELSDDATFQQLSEDQKRVLLRGEVREHNKQLVATAQQAGVETQQEFAIFQDHGYRGLYGGLGARDIHERKGLKKSQKILDHMGSTELAANLFRATQAEEKLRRGEIKSKEAANETHERVGRRVRQTIVDIGGTMPEDLPTPETSVRSSRRRSGSGWRAGMSEVKANAPFVPLGACLVDTLYGTSRPSSMDGTTPIVGIPNVRNGKVRLSGSARVVLPERSREKYSLRPGDLLVIRTNGNRAVVGRTGLVETETDAVFASYLVRLRVDGRQLDPRYLNHWMNSVVGRRQVRRVITEAGQANVNASELSREIRLPLLAMTEQRRIVDVLDICDAASGAARRLAEVKSRQRTALLRRLVDEPASLGDWPFVALSDVCRFVSRRNTIGATRVLTTSGKSGLVSQLDYFSKGVAGEDLSGYYLLRRGEFAYNRSASDGHPYGAIKRLDRYDEGVLSTLNICFGVVDSTVDSGFLCRVFESGLMDRALGRICRVGSRAHGLLNVTKSDFFALRLPLPPAREQTRIATALDSADREVDLLRRLTDAHDRQKNALAAALFTRSEDPR